MQVRLYINTSDERYVNKKINLLADVPIIRNKPIDRSQPVFEIAYNEQILRSNYCYIDTFDRYYYVDSIESESNQMIVRCLECDVLMSFSKYFNNLNATLERQSNLFNTYLSDEQVDVYSNSMYQIINFPNSARVNESFILLVNGG